MTHSIALDWPVEHVAVITFRDPERCNQIAWAAIDELGDVLTSARERGARVVVLASSLPGHWFEHAWLQDLSDGVEGREQTGRGSGWYRVLGELGHEEVVSIAAISGDCAGGGAELGWACDLRIAEAQARFAQPEISMGLTTGIGGTARLARLVGRGLATEMVLTGRPVSAQRLYDLGAVNRVVASGEGLTAALDLAQALAAKSAQATAGLLRILAVNEKASLDEALEFEQATFQAVLTSDEARAGMKAVQQQYDEGVSIADLNHYEQWPEK